MNSFTFTVSNLLTPAFQAAGPGSGTTKSDWVVAPHATTALTVGLSVLKIAAWALCAIVLAVFTGLLRKI